MSDIVPPAVACRFGTEHPPNVPGRDFTPEAQRYGDADLGHLHLSGKTVRPALRTQVLKEDDSPVAYSCVCVVGP